MNTDLSFIEKPLWILFITVTVFSSCIADKTIEIEINNLRCELIDNPVGIDIAVSRLSWELDSKERSVIQLSYRILVSSSLEKLNANEGDLWDSRTVKSDESVFIPYGGEILKSRMECYQNIKIMDIMRPVGIKELGKGIFILDMGQNMVGWLQMKVKGNRGD